MKNENKGIVEQIAEYLINDGGVPIYRAEELAEKVDISEEKIEEMFPGKYYPPHSIEEETEEASYLNELLGKEDWKIMYGEGKGTKRFALVPIEERFRKIKKEEKEASPERAEEDSQ